MPMTYDDLAKEWLWQQGVLIQYHSERTGLDMKVCALYRSYWLRDGSAQLYYN